MNFASMRLAAVARLRGADGVDLIRFFGVLLAGLHVGQTGTVDDDIRMVNIGKTTDNGYILDRYITVAGYQLICCVAAETMTKCGTQSAACSRDPNAGLILFIKHLSCWLGAAELLRRALPILWAVYSV